MLTGEELREARLRAGLTQEQLAAKVNVTLRSVGNWERLGVPRDKQSVLEGVLGDFLVQSATTTSPALSTASDAQLLAEIARRFDRGRGEHGGDAVPIKPADEPDNVTAIPPKRYELDQEQAAAKKRADPRKP